MTLDKRWIDYDSNKMPVINSIDKKNPKFEKISNNTKENCTKVLFIWKYQTYWTPGSPLD